MEKVTASRQYAKALFESCKEAHLIERVEQELKTISELLNAETEARAFLIHPEVPIHEKRAVLASLVPKEIEAETSSFLNLLLKHRLLALLPDIILVFAQMRLEAFGILKAVVETSHPLTEISKGKLKTALMTATKHEVIIDEQLNPNLIGGVRIQVGDRILDGSIIGRLNQIKEKILTSEIKK
jgi:F-type H+-transporting ATPase subunit delta